MTNSTEIIEKKIYPLVEQEISLKITSDEDMEIATKILSQLNNINDQIENEKQKVLTPLNKARTAEINRWKPIVTIYETSIASLRSKLSLYQTKQVQAQKAQEEAIARRIGPGKGKIKLETAVQKIDSLDKPTLSVSTTAGTLSFRAVETLKIVSPDLIPRKYLLPDEKRILETLKGGVAVPGCEIEIVQIPVNVR
jgi:hypothetical protein